jgi:hypothetical protein
MATVDMPLRPLRGTIAGMNELLSRARELAQRISDLQVRL